MTPTEAAQLIQLHSLSPSESSHPKVLLGFVGSLHTWRGFPDATNFKEIMDALRDLGPTLKQPTVASGIVRSVMRIVSSAGMHLDICSMESRHKRYDLTPAEMDILRGWQRQICAAYTSLLDPAAPIHEASPPHLTLTLISTITQRRVLRESARHRGIDPEAYLTDLLTRLPALRRSELINHTPATWAKAWKKHAA